MLTKHKLFTLLLITGMLFIQFTQPADTTQAQAQKPYDADVTYSDTAPQGYIPTPIVASQPVNTGVLVIEKTLPWNSTADTDVLNSWGIPYDIVDMSNLGSVNLNNYNFVLIVNDQVQSFYDAYLTHQFDFENYVKAGGVVVFFAADHGWAGGQLTTSLPGDVIHYSNYDISNQVVDSTHPIVTGILSGGDVQWGGPLVNYDLRSKYASHGYFNDLLSGYHTILTNTANNPTLFTYPLGKGMVIASTLTWEYTWQYYDQEWNRKAFAKKALDDVLLFAYTQGGGVLTGGSIAGYVYANDSSHPLAGALVEACLEENPPDSTGAASPSAVTTATGCKTMVTNVLGEYLTSGLADGSYTLRVLPPANLYAIPVYAGPFTINGGAALTDKNITLIDPSPLPPDTSITPDRGLSTPIVYEGDGFTLTTTGCPGATAASYTTVLEHEAVISSGVLSEGPAGSYSAVIPPLYPHHGNAQTNIAIDCPGGSHTAKKFDIYIDPSGTVKTLAGAPVVGATVTLFNSGNPGGPFTQAPDGSMVMSPVNRKNPDTTDARGHFGWDVFTGYYKVRAEKAGCHSPTNPAQSYVESPVLSIPPAVTDLLLQLDCGNAGLRIFLPLISR